MDVKLIYSSNLMKKMLDTLKTSVDAYALKLKTTSSDEYQTNDELLFNRDSVTQRLEYSIEGFWKYLYLYLNLELGVFVDKPGPRNIIRYVALHRIISEEEASDLMETIEMRNKTSHIYYEEIADEVAKYAPKALKIMQTIFNRLNAKTT